MPAVEVAADDFECGLGRGNLGAQRLGPKRRRRERGDGVPD